MATGGHRCRTRFRSVAPWPEAFSSSERALDRAMGHQIERGLILRDGGNEGNPFLLTSCSSGFSRGGARMGPFSVVQLHRQLPVLLCCPPDQLNGCGRPSSSLPGLWALELTETTRRVQGDELGFYSSVWQN
jgi:hypothetical protein